MIKPGDIPESLVKKAAIMEQDSWYGGRWDNLIAMVLNEAIEAGLVSPPVWAVVCEDRQDEFVVDMLPSQFEAEQKVHWRKDRVKHVKYRVEHWKGRTK